MSGTDPYFAAALSDQEPTEAGRFVDVDSIEVVSFMEGLDFRPVVGRELLVSFNSYAPNTVVPAHAHEEDQITFVVEGEVEFTIGDETRMLRPGTVAVIPPHVPHASRTYDQPCVQLDAFHPPRRAIVDALSARERAE